MRTFPSRRPLIFFAALVLVACSRTDNPHERIGDPPVLQAVLRGVTLVSAGVGFEARLPDLGYQPMPFAANYPGAVRVHALMWEMPEPVVTGGLQFRGSGTNLPDVTLLVAPLPAEHPVADSEVLRSFYRRVLGSEVPRFPASGDLPGDVRVHAWTFAVPNVLEASRKLREKSIALVFSPVAITSAALGDHKVLAIRAPDGGLVMLVEIAAS
jgi:hypothetical protein